MEIRIKNSSTSIYNYESFAFLIEEIIKIIS